MNTVIGRPIPKNKLKLVMPILSFDCLGTGTLGGSEGSVGGILEGGILEGGILEGGILEGGIVEDGGLVEVTFSIAFASDSSLTHLESPGCAAVQTHTFLTHIPGHHWSH